METGGTKRNLPSMNIESNEIKSSGGIDSSGGVKSSGGIDSVKLSGGNAASNAAEAQAMGNAQRDKRLAREQEQHDAQLERQEKGQPVREIIITPDGAATVQRGRDGKVFIEFKKTKVSSDVSKSAATVYSPWDILISFTGGGSYTYRLVPSTVNGVVPNNYTITGTGTVSSEKYISLSVTATVGRITSVSLASASSPTESPTVLQSLPPSEFDIALGVIGTDGKFYKFVAGLPIVASTTVSFESDRTTAIPGLSPRVQWWTWEMSQP